MQAWRAKRRSWCFNRAAWQRARSRRESPGNADARSGAEVGYQVRFDDQTSLGTRISYVTEGILLRRLQEDARLSDTGVVLFDEFHERNLMSDVALALVKRLQATERPDLKLAVMSATLEAEPVARYLALCPDGRGGADPALRRPEFSRRGALPGPARREAGDRTGRRCGRADRQLGRAGRHPGVHAGDGGNQRDHRRVAGHSGRGRGWP